MDSKKLSMHLVSMILFIFLINYLANTFYWYYSIWWFDMPMHFLGGFWLGLFFIYFFHRLGASSNISYKYFFKIILPVLVVGVFWEVFEFFAYNHFGQNPFDALDTVSDIFFDLVGGTFAMIYFFRKIMPIKKDTI